MLAHVLMVRNAHSASANARDSKMGRKTIFQKINLREDDFAKFQFSSFWLQQP